MLVFIILQSKVNNTIQQFTEVLQLNLFENDLMALLRGDRVQPIVIILISFCCLKVNGAEVLYFVG
jgi:hypothetical protein